jgi:hypothetical protein
MDSFTGTPCPTLSDPAAERQTFADLLTRFITALDRPETGQ